MSDPAPRSLLFVPAFRHDWVPKAVAAGPDAVILDLEDAVPPERKPSARTGLASAVAQLRSVGVSALVRPNALATEHGPADLRAAVEAGADGLVVPKVDGGADLERLDAVLEVLERLAGRPGGATAVVPTVESAAGILAVESLASAPRVRAVFAAAARDGDTARSVGFRWTADGLETLAWRTQVVVACRAAGVPPLVGLWQEVGDLDGLRRWASGNRDVGFSGAVVIHPSHVAVANEVFAPSPAELERYRGMLAAVAAAERDGRGAVVYRGEHVDAAHVATARAVVAAAEDRARRGASDPGGR